MVGFAAMIRQSLEPAMMAMDFGDRPDTVLSVVFLQESPWKSESWQKWVTCRKVNLLWKSASHDNSPSVLMVVIMLPIFMWCFLLGPQPWSSWLLNLWKSCVFLLKKKTCPCLAGTIKKRLGEMRNQPLSFACAGSSLRFFDLKLVTFVYLSAYKRMRCCDILWQFSFVRCKVVLGLLNLKNRPDIPRVPCFILPFQNASNNM